MVLILFTLFYSQWQYLSFVFIGYLNMQDCAVGIILKTNTTGSSEVEFSKAIVTTETHAYHKLIGPEVLVMELPLVNCIVNTIVSVG